MAKFLVVVSAVVTITILSLGLWLVTDVQAAEPTIAPNQQSQGDPTATVTPPPTAVGDSVTTEPAATIEPFLQSDLTILSGNVQRPNGLFWHDGFLYTSCSGDFTVYRLDDTTGETVTYIAGVQNAHALYVENTSDNEIQLWVPDYQRNVLVTITEGPQMDMVTDELNAPWGLDVGPDGSFFITELRDDSVLHVQRDGTKEVVAEGLRNPTGIAVDGDIIYVANNGSARRAIEWFDRTSGVVGEDTIQPLVQGLQNTTGLVLGPDRKLYFAYSLGTRGIVGRVDPEACRDKGGCTNVDVEIVLWSELAAPLAGLTLSDDMKLFVHTMFGSEIYWVQLPQSDVDTKSE